MRKIFFITIVILVGSSFLGSAFLKHFSLSFSYTAKILSYDNFYDAAEGGYSGEITSHTNFYYKVLGEKDGNLIIRNIFDVRTPQGNKIFAVERDYGVDPKTGRHIKEYGDKDREGYLFAPRKLKAGQDYTYWHVNYDEPARMEWQDEEEVLGLKVYRYETDYHTDQTGNLGHLPGVPEKRGVNLDINLQTWIEPTTGRLIKYTDNTIAYYYNIETGERIEPWNKFRNKYSLPSIGEQVELAKKEKLRINLLERVIPLVLSLILVTFLLGDYFKKRRKI